MCKWDIAEHAGAPTAVYLASLSSLRSAAVGFQVFSLVVDFFRPVLTASPLASICLTNSLLSAMVSVGGCGAKSAIYKGSPARARVERRCVSS